MTCAFNPMADMTQQKQIHLFMFFPINQEIHEKVIRFRVKSCSINLPLRLIPRNLNQ